MYYHELPRLTALTSGYKDVAFETKTVKTKIKPISLSAHAVYKAAIAKGPGISTGRIGDP